MGKSAIGQHVGNTALELFLGFNKYFR